MEYRKRVEELLLSSGRAGMEKLLEWMAENGYYDERPGSCSTFAEGRSLAEQSLYVLGIMEDVAYLLFRDEEEALEMKRKSLAVCALLHRIGFLGTDLQETTITQAERRAVNIVSSFVALNREEEQAMLCSELAGRNFEADRRIEGLEYALLLFFAEKWALQYSHHSCRAANEEENGVKK